MFILFQAYYTDLDYKSLQSSTFDGIDLGDYCSFPPFLLYYSKIVSKPLKQIFR